MPAAPENSTTEKKTRKGPSPAHVLIAAVQTAVEVGVSSPLIVASLGICRQAKGVEQAPVWRMVSRTLNKESERIKTGSTADQFGDDEEDDDDPEE
jgi:hypothetical protein